MNVFKKFKLPTTKDDNVKGRQRVDSCNQFSLISLNEITEGSIDIWLNLPQEIRDDPCLISFQEEHNRLLGEKGNRNVNNKIVEDDNEIENDVNTDSIALDNDQQEPENVTKVKKRKQKTIYDNCHTFINLVKNYIELIFFLIVWIIIAIFLATKEEKIITMKQLVIHQNQTKDYILPESTSATNRLALTVYGPHITDAVTNDNINNNNFLYINISSVLFNNIQLGDTWKIPMESANEITSVPLINKQHTFFIKQINNPETINNTNFIINIWSNFNYDYTINIGYDISPVIMSHGIIYGSIILILLYILIIWDIVHRTFAAIIAATMSIAVLAALNDRPTVSEIIKWLDVETLLLLFSMMIYVGILTETGIFDFIAVYTYKVTEGNVWALIHCLCIITTIISSFLDNVTTVLLMTPICIRLCEVMDLDSVSVLIAIIVHANIGGTMTPIGDPPNMIITSNHYISKHGVSFLTFTIHMALGVILVVIQTMIHLRVVYKNINDIRLVEPKELLNLQLDIEKWINALSLITANGKHANIVRETLQKRIDILSDHLKKKREMGVISQEYYNSTLVKLQNAYPIKDKVLLIKCGIALAFIMIMFVIQSFPSFQRMTLGWVALVGVLFLLIISKKNNMDILMTRIEWSTLLFFAAMFVLMEALTRLGLIAGIGNIAEMLIFSVDEEFRLGVAIIIILWVSAIASAFVDSIPVTTMMVKVVVSLSENKALGLPLQPLVWALAFGPCLGGNGTLVGASANVVCADIAKKYGHDITFIKYTKFGFPLMLQSVVVITFYLMIAHVIFAWH